MKIRTTIPVEEFFAPLGFVGTTAAIIGASIAAGGSVAGSVIASKGAKKAAETQAEAANRAGRDYERYAREAISREGPATREAIEYERRMTEEGIGRFDEYSQRGRESFDEYAQKAYETAFGVTEAAIEQRKGDVKGAIQARDSYEREAASEYGRRRAQALQERDAYSQLAYNAKRDAGAGATAREEKFMRESVGLQRGVMEQGREDVKPWYDVGAEAIQTLGTEMGEGGRLSKDFSYGTEDFEKDPGYQFRLDEGVKRVERSAAARGGSLGGRAVKEAIRYGSDYASDEYSKAYNRSFTEFQTNQENRYRRLMGLSGSGEQAYGEMGAGGRFFAGQAGQDIVGSGRYGAEVLRDVGAYQAEGLAEGGRAAYGSGMGLAEFNAAGIRRGGEFASGTMEQAGRDYQSARTGYGQYRSGMEFDQAGFQGGSYLDQGRFAGGATVDSGRYGGGAMERSGRYTGDVLLSAGRYQGDATMGAGNARAAGYVGSANAWNQGITGAGNIFQDAIMWNQTKNKAPVIDYSQYPNPFRQTA